MSTITEGCVLGLGNPLLDLQINATQEMLHKYDLTKDNAILAEERHMTLYDEVTASKDVHYVAGGATLNTIKMIQWILDYPRACTYIGCIGADDTGRILHEECDRLKLQPKFQIASKGISTGKCAVLLQDKCRSMVTHLGASKELSLDHVRHPDTWGLVEKAHIYYIAGFAVNSCFEGVLQIAKHSFENGKIFCFNLSAPFLVTYYSEQMNPIIPYVDILFCNNEETEAYATKQGLANQPLTEVAKHLASLPRPSPTARKRIVVVTQAKHPVIVAIAGDPEVQTYPVPPLPSDQIVDTNGAGDALAAGFIADYYQHNSVSRAISSGLKAARYIIQKSGFSLGPRGDYS